MATIGEILVSFKADLAQFQSSMTAARQQIAGVQESAAATQAATSQMAAGFSSLGASVTAAGEAFIAFVSVRAITSFMQSAVEATRSWADELEKLQMLVGVSSEAAGVLGASMKLTGVNADVVTQAMARLGVVMATHPEKLVAIGVASNVAALRQ